VQGEGWTDLAAAVGKASDAEVTVCHLQLDLVWSSTSWAEGRLRTALGEWVAPTWRSEEPLVRRALAERVCATGPHDGLGAFSASAPLTAGALIGLQLAERTTLVVWLGFGHDVDLERLRSLADVIAILAASLHRRQRDFFDRLPAIFIAASVDGVVLDCNRRVCDLGYTPDELIGRPSAVLFATGERDRLRGRLLKTGEVPRFDAVMRHASGEGIAADIMACVVPDEQQRPREVLAVGRDLRPLRAIDHYRRLEAVGRLGSGVAHELNNPLMTVVGNAEMLTEMKLSGSAHRRAERVLAGARRCQEVVDGMLRLRLKHKDLEEQLDLETIIQRSVKAAQVEVEQRCRVEIRAAPDLPVVRGVASDLEQAFINLLRNAFQAVGGRPEPRVQITLSPADDGVQIVVADNGHGMTPAVLERALEPFFTTRAVGAGRGLGLCIVHGIVQEHGGGIELRSDGSGAQVVVSLPAGPARPA
jgi:PAS domain S-box-containing protein